MASQDKKANINPVDLLTGFASGVLTVGVNGQPLLKVDAESRSIDVDTSGVKETGIKLSKLLPPGAGGVTDMIRNSEAMAKGLSDKGWRVTMYDKSSEVLAVGRGVSKLTGYVHVNPLKIRKILETL